MTRLYDLIRDPICKTSAIATLAFTLGVASTYYLFARPARIQLEQSNSDLAWANSTLTESNRKKLDYQFRLQSTKNALEQSVLILQENELPIPFDALWLLGKEKPEEQKQEETSSLTL